MYLEKFEVAGNDYIGLKDLLPGDYFMEDTHPNTYMVTGITSGRRGGVFFNLIVVSKDLDDNIENVEWYGTEHCLVKLKPKVVT